MIKKILLALLAVFIIIQFLLSGGYGRKDGNVVKNDGDDAERKSRVEREGGKRGIQASSDSDDNNEG